MFVVTPSGGFFCLLVKWCQPSPFFTEQLTAFEIWLQHGSEKKKPPEQLPIVLQVYIHTHTLSLLRSCAVYASVANIWGCLNPKPFWPQENAAVLSTVYPNYFCTLKVSAAALKVLPFCVSVFFSSCFFCGCCPASHFFLLLFFSLVFLFVLSLFSSWVFLGFLGFLLS